MLDRFKQEGDMKMVRKLEEAPVTLGNGTPEGYLALRDKAMHALGIGTTHDMKSVVSGIFIPSWLAREYTLKEKVNLWRGRSFSRKFGIWDKLFCTDLTTAVPTLELPVYFFHGQYDYTCSYDLARQYFRQLDAPLKGSTRSSAQPTVPCSKKPKGAEHSAAGRAGGSTSLADARESLR